MSTITSTTFSFLADLKENNNRPWFEENRSRFDASKTEAITLAEELINLVNKFDVIDTPNGKKALYRIYRDIRFSKDKTPYKTHWGMFLKRSGVSRRGGLYLHIEPENKSFLGGGFWSPNKDDLLLLRKQIEADSSPLRAVIDDEEFKTYFDRLQGDQLKTAPKGFDREHPEIDLLRFKQFLVSHPFKDKEVLSDHFPQAIAGGFSKMMPFLNTMTEYLTTDLNGESLL